MTHAKMSVSTVDLNRSFRPAELLAPFEFMFCLISQTSNRKVLPVMHSGPQMHCKLSRAAPRLCESAAISNCHLDYPDFDGFLGCNYKTMQTTPSQGDSRLRRPSAKLKTLCLSCQAQPCFADFISEAAELSKGFAAEAVSSSKS